MDNDRLTSAAIDEIFRGRAKIHGDPRTDALHGAERGVLSASDIPNPPRSSIGSLFTASRGSVGSSLSQAGTFPATTGLRRHCSTGCNKSSSDWFHPPESQLSGGTHLNLAEMP